MGVALVPLVDAAAVEAVHGRRRRGDGDGDGRRVDQRLLPAGRTHRHGPFARTGPHDRGDDLPGREFDMGRCAVLEVGQITILISEQAGIGGNHPAVWRHFGIEPADAKMVVVKTGLELPVLRADDLAGDPRRHRRADPVGHHDAAVGTDPRPIYPLDEPATWSG